MTAAVHAETGPRRTVPTHAIRVGKRHRTDLGDIDSLAADIAANGLINPITVSRDFTLVAGGRRLTAVRQLGWMSVPVHVMENLDDALDRLRVERSENTCRKELTPSEMVSLASELEALERPAARERQGTRTDLTPCDHVDTKSTGKTRDKVADALGTSATTLGRARTIVDAADNDPDPGVRAVAAKARDDMDSGAISIAAAERQVKEARSAVRPPAKRPVVERAAEIADLAATGHRATQIADQLGVRPEYVRKLAREHGVELPDVRIGRSRRIDPDRVVGETVNSLEGIAIGLGLLSDEDLHYLDVTQVDAWATSLSDSLRSLNRLNKALKEMTQ